MLRTRNTVIYKILQEKNTCGFIVLSVVEYFLIKLKTLTHAFSCELCKIFMNTYFEEHLRTAPSGSMKE